MAWAQLSVTDAIHRKPITEVLTGERNAAAKPLTVGLMTYSVPLNVAELGFAAVNVLDKF